MLSLELFTLIFTNVVTFTMFYDSIYKNTNDKYDFLLKKINKIEVKLFEIEKLLDNLEQKTNNQSNDVLFNRLDNYISETYNTI